MKINKKIWNKIKEKEWKIVFIIEKIIANVAFLYSLASWVYLFAINFETIVLILAIISTVVWIASTFNTSILDNVTIEKQIAYLDAKIKERELKK